MPAAYHCEDETVMQSVAICVPDQRIGVIMHRAPGLRRLFICIFLFTGSYEGRQLRKQEAGNKCADCARERFELPLLLLAARR
jgi:hypothetical protein